MPGLVGFVDLSGRKISTDLLTEMAQALESEARFRIDTYRDNRVGLAHVGLGIVNPEPQPVWNELRTRCLVMEGEIYNLADLKEDLLARGRQVAVNDSAELILLLYEEYGEDFVIKLNGAFLAAIWDKTQGKLLLVNDRLGLYPMYYSIQNGRLLFGSGVRALLADKDLSRDVDPTALAEFLTFDHVLQYRTFLASVRLLPQASLLTYYDGRLNIKPYWSCRYPEYYPLKKFQDYIEEFQSLMEQAIRRQSQDNLPLGILLSGGLDSRVILASLSSTGRNQPIHTFTFGIPGCNDARFAREVSQLANAQYHFYELKPDWLLHQAREAVRITDGMGNVVNLHAFATLEQEVIHTPILFKGFLGDAMMGYGLRHQHFASYDESTLMPAYIAGYDEIGCISFYPNEYSDIFSRKFDHTLRDAVIDDYLAGIKASGSTLLADQRNYFDHTQRVPRMTIKGVEVARSRAIVRLPFADNDLFEFSLKVTPGLRYERRLMKEAFIRTFPKYAQVPITETGLPMMACARDVVIRANRVLSWHLQSKGIGLLNNRPSRSYKDYNQWFRTVLRSWVEDNLLSERSLQRGYYNPAYIRELVKEHMAGKNHAVKLGALLSIELWHQQFID